MNTPPIQTFRATGDYGYDWAVPICPRSPMGDPVVVDGGPSISVGTAIMLGAVGVGLWLALKKK